MGLGCLCLVGARGRVRMGDEVGLQGGDRLLGTVVEQTADSVVLDHPTLGRLVTDAEWVLQIDKLDGVKWVGGASARHDGKSYGELTAAEMASKDPKDREGPDWIATDPESLTVGLARVPP